MQSTDFNPWKHVDGYGEHLFADRDSELPQWPIKLWKISPISPYFHNAHLLIAADCTAFAYPQFHNYISRGKVPLVCCPESDFDILTKLSKIFALNEICSVTVVKMEAACCAELTSLVLRAARSSRLPVPVQVTNIFVTAEEID